MDKCAALAHPLPTLAALAPTSSPLLQQRFMGKATSPASAGSRITPSSQVIRRRNNPVRHRDDSTRESAKQHLLELLEDRYATRSTLVTSQLPIEKWHDCLGDPTFADAILDRLVHNAYKLKLKGGSMRKKKASLTQADH